MLAWRREPSCSAFPGSSPLAKPSQGTMQIHLGGTSAEGILARTIFFRARIYSREKCSEISPEMFEPLFCGSRTIPAKIPGRSPSQKTKRFTDELLQERRENRFTCRCTYRATISTPMSGRKSFARSENTQEQELFLYRVYMNE